MKILFHPMNAPEGQEFNDQHAENMMTGNTGGWYEQKSETKKDVINAVGNKGKAKKSEA
jgi:hypothetical protein